MGYQSTAFGILISRHGLGFFPLVCKKVTVWNSGKSKSIVFEGTDVSKIYNLWDEWSDYTEENDEPFDEWTVEYEWYDDILLDEDPPTGFDEECMYQMENIIFSFKNAKNVKIGQVCNCLNMVYLTVAYDGENSVIKPESLNDLTLVQQMMIKDKRLSEQNKLGLFSNCCS